MIYILAALLSIPTFAVTSAPVECDAWLKSLGSNGDLYRELGPKSLADLELRRVLDGTHFSSDRRPVLITGAKRHAHFTLFARYVTKSLVPFVAISLQLLPEAEHFFKRTDPALARLMHDFLSWYSSGDSITSISVNHAIERSRRWAKLHGHMLESIERTTLPRPYVLISYNTHDFPGEPYEAVRTLERLAALSDGRQLKVVVEIPESELDHLEQHLSSRAFAKVTGLFKILR